MFINIGANISLKDIVSLIKIISHLALWKDPSSLRRRKGLFRIDPRFSAKWG